MLNISIPIIVEGRYDKSKILQIANAFVIETNGFHIFKDKQLQKYIQNISKDGIIIMTDSDGAGLNIRGKLNSILPKDKVYNVYIKEEKGKEKRKTEASKEGLIGVEGMSNEYLISLLSPFDSSNSYISNMNLTKTDFYNLGLSGGANSHEKRKILCEYLALPTNLSSNALLSAINYFISKEDFELALEKVNKYGKTE